MTTEKYIAPEIGLTAFHCPSCNVYAHQKKYRKANFSSGNAYQPNLDMDVMQAHQCEHCKNAVIWFANLMIWPLSCSAPQPLDEMPEDVKDDFDEARLVLDLSPRSSAALLRLALQKLCVHLGQPGKNINDDIGGLVKLGLPVMIQQSLDTVRIAANNAVHPGELDMKDNREMTAALFDILNIIVDVMIVQPKKIEALYSSLPSAALKGVDDRDKPKAPKTPKSKP